MFVLKDGPYSIRCAAIRATWNSRWQTGALRSSRQHGGGNRSALAERNPQTVPPTGFSRKELKRTPTQPAASVDGGPRVTLPSGKDPELLRRLLRARDRMDAASQEDWPVRRLARVSCVSAAHFARCFKDAFGVPPHRYLLTRRIERAVALLRDTDLPIIDVAFQTGWKSLGTFGRTFRDIDRKSVV